MRTFLTILLFFMVCSCSPQTQLDSMIAHLRQADFGRIFQVKDSIVNHGKDAVPELIKLLKDTSFIKLKNTADLIYPGAEAFYGHGWIVKYDIDWVALRAAWLLEDITFQNFGYSEGNITEENLMKIHREYYDAYLETGSHTVDFRGETPRQQLIDYRHILADSVVKWWNENKGTWTRFGALKDALTSSDEERQSSALHYLRNELTTCEGLTLASYEKEIMPLVEKIRSSDNSQADQASYLLNDKQYHWFKIKQAGSYHVR